MHRAYRGQPCLGGGRDWLSPANPDAAADAGHFIPRRDRASARVRYIGLQRWAVTIRGSQLRNQCAPQPPDGQPKDRRYGLGGSRRTAVRSESAVQHGAPAFLLSQYPEVVLAKRVGQCRSAGSRTALRSLLSDRRRAPVLVLGTLWPAHWDTPHPPGHRKPAGSRCPRLPDPPPPTLSSERSSQARIAAANRFSPPLPG
jgi:hypothetical protein